eukprot:132303_1
MFKCLHAKHITTITDKHKYYKLGAQRSASDFFNTIHILVKHIIRNINLSILLSIFLLSSHVNAIPSTLPTQTPTRAPTPQPTVECQSVIVNSNSQLNHSDFDGIYTY